MRKFLFKYIKLYIYILPVFSLIGIITGSFRSAYQEDYTLYMQLFFTALDSLLIIAGIKYLNNRTIKFVVFLLLISLLVALFNGNEFSRRYITDFTNPFFFFGKIYIFCHFWKFYEFSKFVKYYIIVAFIGSLLLLPVTYYIFNSAGFSRLAIFPPMELVFSYFVYTNKSTLMIISLLIILLYGKRAQFVGAILALCYSIFIVKRNRIKHFLLVFICGVGVLFTINHFSDNIAISRLLSTVDLYKENADFSAGRTDEIDYVLKDMRTVDYIFGKGLSYTYDLEDMKDVANVHFSPLGFLSKYGIVFTLFIYAYILKILFQKHKRKSDFMYMTALSTVFFVFIESFFAYAIFVTPILPISISYIKYVQNEKNILRF